MFAGTLTTPRHFRVSGGGSNSKGAPRLRATRWTQASISSLRRYSDTWKAYEAVGFSLRQLRHDAIAII